MTDLFTLVSAREEDATRIALEDAERTVTYGELFRDARRVAGRLAKLERFRRGAHVGSAIPRSIEAIVVELAIWAAGGVVVPIDPEWPDARRQFIELDAELVFVVTKEWLGAISDDVEVRPVSRLRDEPALVLYTSGSTGRPKGVCLSHGNILARLEALAAVIPLRRDDVACVRTPPTFVDFLSEHLLPLVTGAKSFVLPHPFALHDLLEALAHRDVSHLLLVPSLLDLLAQTDLANRAPRLQRVVSSGEPLRGDVATRFRAVVPNVALYNIYGSTEVAGDATAVEIDTEKEWMSPSVGIALPGVELRIDDANDELVVVGDVVALGYWGQPDLTRQRFGVDPHSGKRCFRTGDRAKRRADGRIDILGRIDRQVKIAGHRVDLTEVEKTLATHPAVHAAIVVTIERPATGLRLVAGFVPRASVGASELRAFLRERLPAASIPSAFAAFESLPLNAHGKIDRPRFAAEWPKHARTDEISDVARLFADITNAPAVDPDTPFEALGGDSLDILRLLVALERRGHALSVQTLPIPLTARALDEVLAANAVAAVPRAIDETLTDYQRVMAHDSLTNDGPVWTDFVAYSMNLDRPLDRASLARAVDTVVERHAALRTTIERMRRVVLANVSAPVQFIDLSDMRAEDYEERLLAEEWSCMGHRFELSHGPLFEVRVLLGAANRIDVFFTYHHAILDGMSARLVLRDVFAAYDDERIPDRTGVATLAAPSSVDRIVARVRGHRPTPDPEPSKLARGGDAGWRLFHGALALRSFVADTIAKYRGRAVHGPELRAEGYAGGNIADYPLSTFHDRALRAWAKEHGASVDATWATAYALLVARERRTNDVLFGVVVSGRDHGNADAVGMFANCLPLRVELDPDEPVTKLAARMTQLLRELQAASAAPLLEVARRAGVDPRDFLDTLFVSWRFPPVSTRTKCAAGRSLVLSNTRLCLVVAPVDGRTHLGVASRQFHRAHRARCHLAEIADRMLDDSRPTVSALLSLGLPGAALGFRVDGLGA